ncbi:CHAD domain-containing protein [Streptomyces xinghaiensis]|uniref:CHAD domain-containing protein n=1 Tax=Streptomyces xinghaiensis TaxID=1038928 RepID=UPI0037B84413
MITAGGGPAGGGLTGHGLTDHGLTDRTAGEVLAAYLHAQAAEFLRSLRLHRESGSDAEEAVEALLQMRRSARRIGGALHTYRALTDTRWADPLSAELTWLSTTLAREHGYAERLERLRGALQRLSGGAGDDGGGGGAVPAGGSVPGPDPDAGQHSGAGAGAAGGPARGGRTGAAGADAAGAEDAGTEAAGAGDGGAETAGPRGTGRVSVAAYGNDEGTGSAYGSGPADGGGRPARGAGVAPGTGTTGRNDPAAPLVGPQRGSGSGSGGNGRGSGGNGGGTASSGTSARGTLTMGAARAGALLERQLTLARTRAHSAALQALGSSRFHAVADAIALLASEVPLAPDTAGRPAHEVLPPLAEAAYRRLGEAVESLPLSRASHPYNAEALTHALAATGSADAPPAAERQDARWHQVRLLVRLCRYAQEVLDRAGAYEVPPHSGANPVAETLLSAGQALEQHRDAAEAAAAAAAAARTPRIAPATAYALGVLHADQRHEVEAARLVFGRIWQRLATGAL